MTYHDNARTTAHQRKRIRHSRAPYRVQAKALGVSVATVAKWRRRRDPTDRSSRPHRVHKALPPESASLLSWLRKDWLLDLDTVWLALRQTVFSQLSRSAVYRELVRLQLHRLRNLRPRPSQPHGRFRACPPGFVHIDSFALPRLGVPRRYLFVAIDRATRLMTMQVACAFGTNGNVGQAPSRFPRFSFYLLTAHFIHTDLFVSHYDTCGCPPLPCPTISLDTDLGHNPPS